MKISLRERTRNGKTSLYLDYYSNGNRKTEYLKLYLIEKPKTTQERNINKQTKILAESIRAKRQLDIQTKNYGFNSLTPSKKKFMEYFEELSEKRKDSNGNYGNWQGAYKHLQNWEQSDISLVDINSIWLEDLKDYLIHEALTPGGRKLSKNSCYSYFNKVKATLNQAERDHLINTNPAKLVKGIKESETQREFLTLEELNKVVHINCSNEQLKRAFLFSCLTGLRFSDVQKLKWSEIQHSEENGYYIRFTQKKTKGQETLPITEDIFQFTGEHQNSEEKVFKDLVYSDKNNVKLREWMIRAGIEKHITFHSARHTYATLQLTLGTDIYTVSKLLGHRCLKTTEVYAKIIDTKKQEAANRIKLTI